jgi:hypothetical protein
MKEKYKSMIVSLDLFWLNSIDHYLLLSRRWKNSDFHLHCRCLVQQRYFRYCKSNSAWHDSRLYFDVHRIRWL